VNSLVSPLVSTPVNVRVATLVSPPVNTPVSTAVGTPVNTPVLPSLKPLYHSQNGLIGIYRRFRAAHFIYVQTRQIPRCF
jgi:hypothetical protein